MVLFGRTSGGARFDAITCTVDGEPTPPDNRSTGDFFACAWEGAEPRDTNGNPHSFLLNVSGIPEGGAFSIDSLWYLPSPTSGQLYDELGLVEYDHNDPEITYMSGDWQPLSDDRGDAMVATQAGSSATVLFTGKQQSVFQCSGKS
jgi:hypothetical protein